VSGRKLRDLDTGKDRFLEMANKILTPAIAIPRRSKKSRKMGKLS